MTKVRQQILEVMKTIYNEWKLNPEDKPFKIWIGKFENQPDYKAVIKKLSEQYKVIVIEKLPNQEGVREHEFGLVENDWGEDGLKDLLSYTLSVDPNFETFYKTHYADNSINVPSLNEKNFWIVMDTAEQIFDQINMSAKDSIVLQANETSGYIYKGLKDSLNYSEIQKFKESSLQFLQTQNAISSFKPVTREETDGFAPITYEVVDKYIVEVNRHVFHEVYDELTELMKKYTDQDEENYTDNDSSNNHISFDFENYKLHNGKRSIEVGSTTLEYFILKSLLDVPIGKGVDVTDIIDEWGGQENKQTMYDAITRLNRKFRQLLGTTSKDIKVVYQKSSKIHFDKQYSDSITTQS